MQEEENVYKKMWEVLDKYITTLRDKAEKNMEIDELRSYSKVHEIMTMTEDENL